MKKFIIFAVILSGLLVSISAFSQENLDVRAMSRQQIKSLTYEQLSSISMEDLMFISDKFGISIDDLLNQAITVSSKTALSPRETPGVISILTTDDIVNSGAVDLADLLRLIPGIYFGMDVDGIIGMFMRGNWGLEGKVLFLIDDMEINENMYSVMPLINHIPASQISRIEVIRGPGSALYGGYAELGVIKVTTRSGQELNGNEVAGVIGSFGKNINRTGVDVATGRQVGHSSYSVMGSWSKIDRAGGTFSNFDGDTYNMEEGWSDSKNLMLNMKYNYKGFDANVLYNDYAVVPTTYEVQNDNRFRSFLSQVRYSFQPTNTLKITPGIFFKRQTPYWLEDKSAESDWFYKRTVNQTTGSVDMVWMPSSKIQLLAGVGHRFDRAVISDEEKEVVGEPFYNDKFTLLHQNTFAYAQGSYSGSWGNLFAGFRFENHSVTGSNIAPRLGYTKVFNRFNLKYLYSHAFRSPSIENVNTNRSINPEKTIVNELVFGYRFSDHFYGSLNLYDIIINDPIVYEFDYENNVEGYVNEGKTGTTGLEFELRAMYEKWTANISYSHYDASRNNKTDVYRVMLPSGDNNRLMKGAPAHMIHLVSSIKLKPNLTLNPAFSWYSEQYGYVASPDFQSKSEAYLIADLNLQMKHVMVKNFDVTVSLRNLFDAKYQYIQPFVMEGDGERPIPGRPFEAVVRLKYRF